MISELQRQILEYLKANHPHRVRFQYMLADFDLEEETLVSELLTLEKAKLIQLAKFKKEETTTPGIHSINLSERGTLLLTDLWESEYEAQASQ
jgi:hypothetical protein